MKNHIKVDGKLLQTNKKWSHLKGSQRSWVAEITAEEHANYVAEHGKLPMKKTKLGVVDKVWDRIVAKDIWIPFYEAKFNINKYIDRQNRKSPLFAVPKAKAQKPKKPQAPMEEFPAEVQEKLIANLTCDIGRYIQQAHKIPSNKIRDSHIKIWIQKVNATSFNQFGKRLMCSDTLLTAYGDIRTDCYSRYKSGDDLSQIVGDTKRERNIKANTICESERLIIRKLLYKDWPDIQIMLADPNVMYACERTFSTKHEVVQWMQKQWKRYKNDKAGYFAAVEKQSGRMVGQIGLMWNDLQGERCLEVGYILKKEFWHNGFATEGAKACIDYGFSALGVEKIYATIRSENEASVKLAEKLGMHLEGEYIKSFEGKEMKHLIYSISNNSLI